MYYLHDSNITISLSPTPLLYLTGFRSGFKVTALESNETLVMRPVPVCPRKPFFSVQVVNSPSRRGFRHHPIGTLWAYNSIYTRPDESLVLG